MSGDFSKISDWVPGADTQYDAFQSASNPAANQTHLPRPRYRLLSAADALLPPPPIEWVVKNMIERGIVCTIFGEPGCGKTWAMLDLVICVALGKDWVGYSTNKHNVLIIDEESGERRLMRRMGEVMRGHNADASTPVFSVSYARFDFAKPHDVGELIHLINSGNVGLVIIDALSDVAPGKDENATKEMKPILMNLKYIAEDTQAAIILIHHSNKQGNYRGASTIKADVDMMVKVEKSKDIITLTSEKVRDGEAFTFSALANWMSLDPKEFWLTSSNSPKSKSNWGKGQTYIFRYLLTNAQGSREDIKNNADSCSPRTAENALDNLVNLGYVERANAGGRGITGIYQLTQKGKDETNNI